MTLSLQALRDAVVGNIAALRCVTTYEPAGGPSSPVFPPTYAGRDHAEYAVEKRRVDTGEVNCVILDSVQSQANRAELALLEAHRSNRVRLPLMVVRFDAPDLLRRFTVTSLEAPHRAADALFRDSLLDGIIFRQSTHGRVLDNADIRNAAGLFGLNPTALLFGLWDSTGPRGGLGAKFQRAFVSEIVGYDVVQGVKTSSRMDPAQIQRLAGPLYARKSESKTSPRWTLDQKLGGAPLGKDGRPSEAVHGNIPPSIDVNGGFTIGRAIQTTVLSLVAIRRLRFPSSESASSDPAVDAAARIALAALGLAAATLAREEGADLRSRCLLVPTEAFKWELLGTPGKQPITFTLTGDEAVALLNDAVRAAKGAGLPWSDEIELTPSPDLVELVRRSQQLAITSDSELE